MGKTCPNKLNIKARGKKVGVKTVASCTAMLNRSMARHQIRPFYSLTTSANGISSSATRPPFVRSVATAQHRIIFWQNTSTKFLPLIRQNDHCIQSSDAIFIWNKLTSLSSFSHISLSCLLFLSAFLYFLFLIGIEWANSLVQGHFSMGPLFLMIETDFYQVKWRGNEATEMFCRSFFFTVVVTMYKA